MTLWRSYSTAKAPSIPKKQRNTLVQHPLDVFLAGLEELYGIPWPIRAAIPRSTLAEAHIAARQPFCSEVFRHDCTAACRHPEALGI